MGWGGSRCFCVALRFSFLPCSIHPCSLYNRRSGWAFSYNQQFCWNYETRIRRCYPSCEAFGLDWCLSLPKGVWFELASKHRLERPGAFFFPYARLWWMILPEVGVSENSLVAFIDMHVLLEKYAHNHFRCINHGPSLDIYKQINTGPQGPRTILQENQVKLFLPSELSPKYCGPLTLNISQEGRLRCLDFYQHQTLASAPPHGYLSAHKNNANRSQLSSETRTRGNRASSDRHIPGSVEGALAVNKKGSSRSYTYSASLDASARFLRSLMDLGILSVAHHSPYSDSTGRHRGYGFIPILSTRGCEHRHE